MSTRLQVVVDPAELREIQEAASRHGMTVSDWVRHTLRAARRVQGGGDTARKLAVIRAASEQRHPTADIDQMLTEIEGGYLGPDAG